MSTTTQGIDARAYLSGWLQGLTGMYLADIKAIPDDKWNATFGGCTRPASELTVDALSLIVWVTGALKGTPEGEYDHSEAMKLACATKESASETLKSTTEAFAAALNAASDEDLNRTIMAPWQMESPLFGLAQVAVSHLWYHDGQLNYIHCLLGDDKVHWMGD